MKTTCETSWNFILFSMRATTGSICGRLHILFIKCNFPITVRLVAGRTFLGSGRYWNTLVLGLWEQHLLLHILHVHAVSMEKGGQKIKRTRLQAIWLVLMTGIESGHRKQKGSPLKEGSNSSWCGVDCGCPGVGERQQVLRALAIQPVVEGGDGTFPAC